MARRTICRLIKCLRQQPTTITELSQSIHASRENVRDWLKVMEKEGLVERAGLTLVELETGTKWATLWRWKS